MLKVDTPTAAEFEKLDAVYREGGLQRMASPHIHYQDAACPHAGCEHRMEWIDFQLERFNDPEGVYNPLVRAWWQGIGFVGRCPQCGGWVRFTTLRMEPVAAQDADQFPRLPADWHTVAQFG